MARLGALAVVVAVALAAAAAALTAAGGATDRDAVATARAGDAGASDAHAPDLAPALAGRRAPPPVARRDDAPHPGSAAAGPDVYLAPSNGYAPEPPPLPEDAVLATALAADASVAGGPDASGEPAAPSDEAGLAAALARPADERRPASEVARLDVTAVVADRTRRPGGGWPARDGPSWSETADALRRLLEQAVADARLERPAGVRSVPPSEGRLAFDVDGGPEAVAAAARALDAATTLGGPAFTVRVEVFAAGRRRGAAGAPATTLLFDVPSDGVVTAHAGPAQVRWTDLDIEVGNSCSMAPIFGVERDGVFVRGHVDGADPAAPAVVLVVDDEAGRLVPYDRTLAAVSAGDLWPSPTWLGAIGLAVRERAFVAQQVLRVEAREGAVATAALADGRTVRAAVEAFGADAPRERRWSLVPREVVLAPSATELPDLERLVVTVEDGGTLPTASRTVVDGTVGADGPERAVVVASPTPAERVGVADGDEPARTALAFAAPLALWARPGPAVASAEAYAPRAFDLVWEAVGAVTWREARVPTRFEPSRDLPPTTTVNLPAAAATVVPWRVVLRPGESVERDLVLDLGAGPEVRRVSIRRAPRD